MLHISPESALQGSVFGIIQDDNMISFDCTHRNISLEVEDDEIQCRIHVRKSSARDSNNSNHESSTYSKVKDL